MKTSRPSWDEYGITLAKAASTMSTCRKLDVGAVILHNATKRVLSTGFNGNKPGEVHCLDVECEEVNNHCKRTVHAEENAIKHLLLHYHPRFLQYCTLYVTHFPCKKCAEAIIEAKIPRIVYLHDYKPHGLFIDTDIEVIKI